MYLPLSFCHHRLLHALKWHIYEHKKRCKYVHTIWCVIVIVATHLCSCMWPRFISSKNSKTHKLHTKSWKTHKSSCKQSNYFITCLARLWTIAFICAGTHDLGETDGANILRILQIRWNHLVTCVFANGRYNNNTYHSCLQMLANGLV